MRCWRKLTFYWQQLQRYFFEIKDIVFLFKGVDSHYLDQWKIDSHTYIYSPLRLCLVYHSLSYKLPIFGTFSCHYGLSTHSPPLHGRGRDKLHNNARSDITSIIDIINGNYQVMVTGKMIDVYITACGSFTWWHLQATQISVYIIYETGPLFTKKTPSYQYRDSHYKPETVVRPS